MGKRGLVVRGALAVALLAASGCFWQLPGADSNRSAYNSLETRITVDTVAGLVPRWEATVDEGPVSSPVTSTRGVHVAAGSSLYAFDARTGAERWQYTYTDWDRTRVLQPYVWRDRVLANQWVQTHWFRSVIELDAASGEVAANIPDVHLAALQDDRAILVSNEPVNPGPGFPIITVDSLRVQNLHTGETQPLGRFNTSLNGYAPDQYAVTLAGDWVVHAGRGLDRGTATFGPGLRGYSISNPVTSCGATSSVTVCPNWSTTEGGVGPPVLSRDGAVVYDAARAYDTATGAVLWDRSTSPGGPPALTADTVYTATADGLLHAYSVDGSPQNGCPGGTCDPSWSATLGFTPDLSLQPAVAGGVVFVAGAGGEIAAVDAAGCGSPPCAPLWTGSVGSQITGSPAVSNGQLYVGTADGRLVAFGLPAV